MRRWDRLNERQLNVLRRIGDGAEPVTSKDSGLAITVYALRGRGLVTTPRNKGAWRAEITDAGRFYLDHGYHPEQPAKSPPPDPGAAHGAVDRPRRRVARREITAAELIRQVEEAGGWLRIEDPDSEARAAWRRAVHAARRDDLMPAGRNLGLIGRDRGPMIIYLSDRAEPSAATDKARQPVPVPDDLSAPHPVVAALQQDPAPLGVRDAVLPRVLRIVQAIAAEAGRRGHQVVLAGERGSQQVCVEARGSRYELTFDEEHDRVPHVPTPAERGQRTLYPWQRIIPAYDSVPSGRIRLTLAYLWNGRRYRWADRKRWRLEDKLGEVLAEIETRAAADEAKRLEREREEAERQRQWEDAMAKARTRFVHEHRRVVFTGQFKAWRRADDIRRFCAALEAAANRSPDSAQADVTYRWINWATAYADSIDPTRALTNLTGLDFDPEPAPDDLRPYLGRWSPHGPELSPQFYRAPQAQVADDLGQSEWRHGRPGRAQWWRH